VDGPPVRAGHGKSVYIRGGLAIRTWVREDAPMLNLVSLLLGAVALFGAIIAFVPLLGWLNWAVLPISLLGAGIGMASERPGGRRLNIFVLVAGGLRLMLGGGLF